MMPTVDVCPVEPGAFEFRGARLGQFLLVTIILATLVTQGTLRIGLLTLLVVDLACKGFISFRVAPLSLCARTLAHWLVPRSGAAKRLNVGPKRFAARVGLSFALAMALAQSCAYSTLFVAVGVMFALAALLDATTGLCIACIVYSKISRNRH